MLDITTSVHSGLHENLKHHIEKGIKCNSNDETENVQKIFNTIKKTAASNKCKQYTLVFLYATAYCYKENNTVLIPIIRVEWMENFTVDFLTKTGKKFNSINKLIRKYAFH